MCMNDVCPKCGGRKYLQIGESITNTTPCECSMALIVESWGATLKVYGDARVYEYREQLRRKIYSLIDDSDIEERTTLERVIELL